MYSKDLIEDVIIFANTFLYFLIYIYTIVFALSKSLNSKIRKFQTKGNHARL